MLCLYLEAPFAACRTFTAGWYRPTATFLTPSAAYGLVLNVAGVESRLREEEIHHDGRVPASLLRLGLPAVSLALGAPAFRVARDGAALIPVDEVLPSVQTVYQQLHNYPVGSSGSGRAESARGNKYNITPVRRELLCGLRALILLDGNAELEGRVRAGLRGDLPGPRYGLPFVGDNQYLPDRLDEVPWPLAGPDELRVRWYERLEESASGGPRPHTSRLTIWIDRADLSRTTSALFAPTEEAIPTSVPPPQSAWTSINPPPAPAPTT
jgi:CRISPR-associated protein Cas5t